MNEKIDRDSLLGCIKFRGEYNFYLMPIAWWILDYKKYDPTYNPLEWSFTFRDNILTVEDGAFGKFVKSISSKKVSDVPAVMQLGYWELTFLIDFDQKFFVSGFEDIAVEEYIPKGWHGEFGNPSKYLLNRDKMLLNIYKQ